MNGFSLVEGGPLHALLVRLRLIEPGAPPGKRAVTFFVLVTWLPPVLLALAEGVRIGPDFRFHLRFVAALPLLLLAEGLVGRHMRAAVRHVQNEGLLDEVDEEGRRRLDHALTTAAGQRDSLVAEVTMVVLVTAMSAFGWRENLVSADWTTGPRGLNLAGGWYLTVGIPLYRFLLLRWVWRICIWSVLLWRISRLRLRLQPAHPDGAGGLGFLGYTQSTLALVLFPVSITAAANAAGRIVFDGVRPEALQPVLLAWVLVATALTIAPLVPFTPALILAKRDGLFRYGALAQRYTRRFDDKWAGRGGPEPQEELLGTPDMQSLADLGGAFEVIARMKPIPLQGTNVGAVVGAALLPLLPLALTVVPLEAIPRLLFKLLFGS